MHPGEPNDSGELEAGVALICAFATEKAFSESPDAQKGKNAAPFKLVDPLTSVKADQVVDHPGGDVTSKLAKPAIEITLTDKNKKTITLKVAKPAGDVVYAQSSDAPSAYKLKKQDFDSLNLDPANVLE